MFANFQFVLLKDASKSKYTVREVTELNINISVLNIFLSANTEKYISRWIPLKIPDFGPNPLYPFRFTFLKMEKSNL